jgi:hypothetical protein
LSAVSTTATSGWRHPDRTANLILNSQLFAILRVVEEPLNSLRHNRRRRAFSQRIRENLCNQRSLENPKRLQEKADAERNDKEFSHETWRDYTGAAHSQVVLLADKLGCASPKKPAQSPRNPRRTNLANCVLAVMAPYASNSCRISAAICGISRTSATRIWLSAIMPSTNPMSSRLRSRSSSTTTVNFAVALYTR